MGNTPTNTPYEPLFFERLLGWWEESGAQQRFSLLFRPHPRDKKWEQRFAAGDGARGSRRATGGRGGHALARRDARSTARASSRTRARSCSTSLVNDRPAVCVLYDEGAPAGETWAAKNVLGVHYRELMSSTAFYRATTFDEVTDGIERALDQPAELLGGAAAGRARGGRRSGRPRRRARRGRDRAAGRGGVSGAANLGHRQRLPSTRRSAADVGRLLAERGATLVCGGLDEVMAAAARGAKEAGGVTLASCRASRRSARESVDRSRRRDGHRARPQPRRRRVG